MKKHLLQQFLIIVASIVSTAALAQAPRFRVLVVASRASDHLRMIAAAQPFFQRMADSADFALDFTDDTSVINTANLKRYQVFVMLHLAPFDMSYAQQEALQRFIEGGGGWVGIHAAGLTGATFLAPHTRYWQWFEDLMGGVVYSPHPAYQQATLVVEDRSHPATHGLPSSFPISDEWYEFDHSPRAQVRVLARVDESTYHQNKPMGDHPIVWTNEQYPHTIYIGVGHDPSALQNPAYAALVKNAILWAGRPSIPIPMKEGRVSYTHTQPTLLSPGYIYAQARRWFEGPSPDHNLTLTFADSTHLAGTQVLRVPMGDHYYLVRYRLEVSIADGQYTIRTSHYEEQPVKKGVTNEYSRVEYRWWDFRAGKPWSGDDSALFAGLDKGTRSLWASLERGLQGAPRFRVLALYENGGWHVAYTQRARLWLDRLSLDSNFRVDYVTNTDSIDDAFLSRYPLFLQLDYAPYAWKPAAVAAFQRYIDEGRGGWVGFHHATLLGEFDGYPMWPWFSAFMGGIRWKDYIARFARATVRVEDRTSPLMTGVPDTFVVQKEEWYTYDKSPRPNVHVLASVNESSYFPDTTVKMGDHPVIWTNEHVKARNAYIFMGHSPILFDDSVYTRIFRNAIFWAANPHPAAPDVRFRVLALYTTTVEPDHVDFARQAIRFYQQFADERGFALDTTTNWSRLNDADLSRYKVVVWLNDFPQNAGQRAAFERYMEHGGAWLGFHVAAYNDRYTRWPWFVRFLGGAVFYDNNWPPLPVPLHIDEPLHPVTRGLPGHFMAPPNEWYGWRPSPRLDKDVEVLVTLDSAAYPLGKKDQIRHGDVPVVWTNKRYHMLYMNMGHGDQVFASPVQNELLENALLWLGER